MKKEGRSLERGVEEGQAGRRRRPLKVDGWCKRCVSIRALALVSNERNCNSNGVVGFVAANCVAT
jgi:hypothetical protein